MICCRLGLLNHEVSSSGAATFGATFQPTNGSRSVVLGHQADVVSREPLDAQACRQSGGPAAVDIVNGVGDTAAAGCGAIAAAPVYTAGRTKAKVGVGSFRRVGIKQFLQCDMDSLCVDVFVVRACTSCGVRG